MQNFYLDIPCIQYHTGWKLGALLNAKFQVCSCNIYSVFNVYEFLSVSVKWCHCKICIYQITFFKRSRTSARTVSGQNRSWSDKICKNIVMKITLHRLGLNTDVKRSKRCELRYFDCMANTHNCTQAGFFITFYESFDKSQTCKIIMVIWRYLWRGMTWLLREERRREKLRQWYQIFISVLSYSYRQNSSLHLLISWYFIILYQDVSVVSNININSQSYFSKGSRWSLQKCSLRSSQRWL